jgi:hypothetical protein
MYVFGAGNLWAVPLTDSLGSAISNPTPVKFGTMQEVSLDISFDVKELHGQLQFPVAIGRGKGKLGGKAKLANISGALMNALLFGQTLSAGRESVYIDTVGAAIPTTPFQITTVPPSSGTFAADLGVRDSTGKVYTRVASAPATGQYSVSAGGVYTFAAADTTKTVYIDYRYTATSTSEVKSTVTNQPLGYIPTFSMDLYMPYNGKYFYVRLPSCVSTKLGMATKLDDFAVPEFDFSAFADAGGNVMTYGVTDSY